MKKEFSTSRDSLKGMAASRILKQQNQSKGKTDYSESDLKSFRSHLESKSHLKAHKSKLDQLKKQHEKEKGRYDYHQTVRMGYAMKAGIGDKQSRIDAKTGQSLRNRHFRDLLEYKYTQLSQTRNFKSTAKKGYLHAKSQKMKKDFTKSK